MSENKMSENKMSEIKKSISKVYVKKISTKLMVGDIKKVPCGELYKVIGSAIGLKTGISAYGDWTALIGMFEAWNDEHNVFSNKIFLPDVALVPIACAVKEGETVEFGLIIKKVDSDNPMGFEYAVETIIPQKESKQLVDLRYKFGDFLKKK